MEDFPPKCGRKRCVKMVVPNLSVLTSVRRIVKIAVRFLHTKTALCDRKDTQSRFAVNAARSIVCVETPPCSTRYSRRLGSFNAARSIVCVETPSRLLPRKGTPLFQCRTQHCVCRDAVSRSPCPARAEKAFWKDALFCAVFGVCG